MSLRKLLALILLLPLCACGGRWPVAKPVTEGPVARVRFEIAHKNKGAAGAPLGSLPSSGGHGLERVDFALWQFEECTSTDRGTVSLTPEAPVQSHAFRAGELLFADIHHQAPGGSGRLVVSFPLEEGAEYTIRDEFDARDPWKFVIFVYNHRIVDGASSLVPMATTDRHGGMTDAAARCGGAQNLHYRP